MIVTITTVGDCEHGIDREIKFNLNIANYKDLPKVVEFCETYLEYQPSYSFSLKEE